MDIYTMATYQSDLERLPLLRYYFNVHRGIIMTWATSFLPIHSTDYSLEIYIIHFSSAEMIKSIDANKLIYTR